MSEAHAALWQDADWPAPPGVRAGTTLRLGGASEGACATLNLALHVADDPAAVAENRRRLAAALALPAEPFWLHQVHGRDIARHDGRGGSPTADGAVASGRGRVLAVLTADCLPVVLASRDGEHLGIAHAGWRGLERGVIEATVGALGVAPTELLAWLGPAIGPAAFEVGEEVRRAFVAGDAGAASAFAANARGRWQADIYALARRRLGALGIDAVSGGGGCTFTEEERYFSYRRDPKAGRMATLVWREAAAPDRAG